jgi:hypothetical protein
MNAISATRILNFYPDWSPAGHLTIPNRMPSKSSVNTPTHRLAQYHSPTPQPLPVKTNRALMAPCGVWCPARMRTPLDLQDALYYQWLQPQKLKPGAKNENEGIWGLEETGDKL